MPQIERTVAPVTAVIPTAGRRPSFLRNALRSVVTQTLLPQQVLVVVDGSADDQCSTRLVCDGLSSEQVPVEILETPGEASCGVSAARNLGAAAATTEFLAFLDDDDQWKPGLLASVFARTASFDLALVAFEKHSQGAVHPEKVPPESLEPAHFHVRNPGLRGSNLVIRSTLYQRVGGFDPELPAFNDMDFGIKVSGIKGIRYRRILEPLVEFHAHGGRRLSTAGSEANRVGMDRFLARHGSTMKYLSEAAFRQRAIELWSDDPWHPQRIRERMVSSERGDLPRQLPSLLHALETRSLEQRWRGNDDTAEMRLLQDLLHRYEVHPDRPRPPKLRIALTTTNSSGSLAQFLGSLIEVLDLSRWAVATLPERPLQVLIVENDTDARIREEHRAFIADFDDSRTEVTHLTWNDKTKGAVPARPWSLATSRAYLMHRARAYGWIPAPDAPLWLLDEDLSFTTLLPERTGGFRRVAFLSLLHRLECLCSAVDADALIGGNTGAPPVQALSLMRSQIKDLVRATLPTETNSSTSTSSAAIWPWLLERPEYYYDLSTDSMDLPPVPLPVLNETEAGYEPTQVIDSEVVGRLLSGVPVTRPLPLRYEPDPASAWGTPRPVSVSGGNVLLLSERVLRPDLYHELTWQGGVSRRADSGWAVLCAQAGCRLLAVQLPPEHRRKVFCNAAPPSDMLWCGQVSDAVGVAMVQTIESLGPPRPDADWEMMWADHYRSRRKALLANGRAAAEALDCWKKGQLEQECGLLCPEAIHKILSIVPPDAPAVDVGIPRHSGSLEGLARLGYRRQKPSEGWK